MTSEERNAVIDECIALVRSFDRGAVLRATFRAKLSGRNLPTETHELIALGLELLLKEPAPLHVQSELRPVPAAAPSSCAEGVSEE